MFMTNMGNIISNMTIKNNNKGNITKNTITNLTFDLFFHFFLILNFSAFLIDFF